jgi:hypothetical protein
MTNKSPKQEVEWWRKKPYNKTASFPVSEKPSYDIPAILAEQRKRVVEECLETLDHVKPDLPYGEVSGGSLQTHFHIVAAFEDARIMAKHRISALLNTKDQV